MARKATFNPQQHIGKKFGRWTVIHYGRRREGGHTFICECKCGETSEVYYHSLKRGGSKSCGCLKKEMSTKRATTHGYYGSPLYAKYYAMIERCNHPNNVNYKNYGGRGIKICNAWLKDYKNFEKWAMQAGYKRGLSIDRINNDGDYTPDNCKWSNYNEQANNRRSNRKITFKGRTQNLKQWANEIGIHDNTLRARIDVSGWSLEKALTTPVKKH